MSNFQFKMAAKTGKISKLCTSFKGISNQKLLYFQYTFLDLASRIHTRFCKMYTRWNTDYQKILRVKN